MKIAALCLFLFAIAVNLTEGSSKWMKYVADNTKLGAMSIPGTHNSMTKHGRNLFSVVYRTQEKKLNEQLKQGIRFVDIRLRHTAGGKFAIHHGVVFLNVWLDDVLSTLQTFLVENPSETVIMSWQKEHDDENESTFCADLRKVFRKYRSVYSGYKSRDTPTLGELRGKIFLMNFHKYGCGSETGYVGHTFDNGPHSISRAIHSTTANDWKSKSRQQESSYTNDLISNLKKSKAGTHIFTTWISVQAGKGGLIKDAAQKFNGVILNKFLRKDISSRPKPKLGGVIMDFSTQAMINSIIAFNN